MINRRLPNRSGNCPRFVRETVLKTLSRTNSRHFPEQNGKRLSYLGVGSNQGNRQKNINTAIKKLQDTEGIEVRRVSSIIETEPEGGPPQNRFLNGAIEIRTNLSPFELLKQLKRIEKELGRVRTVKNGPRPIDLDILLYGDKKVNTARLKIPHPRMQRREFVMKPLKELQFIPTPIGDGE